MHLQSFYKGFFGGHLHGRDPSGRAQSGA